MPLSNKAKNIISKQDVYAKFPFLIKITHTSFIDSTKTEEMYYCNSEKEIEFEGKFYKPAIFKITPPETTTTKVGNATLEMACIDQVWIQKIRQLQNRAKIQFIGVIEYQDDEQTVIEKIFDNQFTLTNATWTEVSISWTMVFDDKWDIKVPTIICDTLNTPGVS